MAVKAIFFDAAGTLMKSARPVGETYASLAKKYGMKVSPVEMRERFRKCFSSAPPLAFPGARPAELKELERGWWKELVLRIFEPYGNFPRFERYFSDLFEYFGRAASWSLYPETERTLGALKERGYTLAVISNFDSRLFGILKGLGIDSWFDSIIISSHAGYAKPAPEIFHKTLALYELKAEEALHIGDSAEKDAAGAEAAGLRGVLLDRNGRFTSNSFLQVRSLKEILSLAGSLPPRSA